MQNLVTVTNISAATLKAVRATMDQMLPIMVEFHHDKVRVTSRIVAADIQATIVDSGDIPLPCYVQDIIPKSAKAMVDFLTKAAGQELSLSLVKTSEVDIEATFSYTKKNVNHIHTYQGVSTGNSYNNWTEDWNLEDRSDFVPVTFDLPSKLMVAMCGSDKQRPALQGVYFCDGDAVATDGTRMVVEPTAYNSNIPLLLHKDLLLALHAAKATSLTLLHHSNVGKVQIHADNGVMVSTSVIYERYPDYKAAYPTEKAAAVFTMDARYMIDALANLPNSGMSELQMSLTPEKVEVSLYHYEDKNWRQDGKLTRTLTSPEQAPVIADHEKPFTLMMRADFFRESLVLLDVETVEISAYRTWNVRKTHKGTEMYVESVKINFTTSNGGVHILACIPA
jgi:hypothetical protein